MTCKTGRQAASKAEKNQAPALKNSNRLGGGIPSRLLCSEEKHEGGYLQPICHNRLSMLESLAVQSELCHVRSRKSSIEDGRVVTVHLNRCRSRATVCADRARTGRTALSGLCLCPVSPACPPAVSLGFSSHQHDEQVFSGLTYSLKSLCYDYSNFWPRVQFRRFTHVTEEEANVISISVEEGLVPVGRLNP